MFGQAWPCYCSLNSLGKISKLSTQTTPTEWYTRWNELWLPAHTWYWQCLKSIKDFNYGYGSPVCSSKNELQKNSFSTRKKQCLFIILCNHHSRRKFVQHLHCYTVTRASEAISIISYCYTCWWRMHPYVQTLKIKCINVLLKPLDFSFLLAYRWLSRWIHSTFCRGSLLSASCSKNYFMQARFTPAYWIPSRSRKTWIWRSGVARTK